MSSTKKEQTNLEPSGRRESPQTQFDNLVKLFWANNPFIKDINKNNELEVRFGTKGIRPLTKIDYDNVIRKLKSLGFTSHLEQGNYMLRISNEFLDPATSKFKVSSIRTEINGFHAIQEYCNHNDIKKLMASGHDVQFHNKGHYSHGVGKDAQRTRPVNFDDFNFRVSYSVENKMRANSGVIQNIVDT
jgi:hypothetical protein